MRATPEATRAKWSRLCSVSSHPQDLAHCVQPKRHMIGRPLIFAVAALGLWGCVAPPRATLNGCTSFKSPDPDVFIFAPRDLIRPVPIDSVEAHAIAEELANTDTTQEVDRRIFAQQSAWIRRELRPILAVADSVESVWLYNSSNPRTIGGTRGYVALRGCQVIAVAALTIYE